jgi:peptidoglycan/xylan/chitin deacetylase (PgdA/CDA1 family)
LKIVLPKDIYIFIINKLLNTTGIMKIIFSCTCLLLFCSISAQKAASGKTEITKWQYDKKGAVSITYDDGSKNQFLKAMPIMDRLSIPGTFYIITGQIAGSRYHGKFIGRPVKDIILETATIPTSEKNLFERFSAAAYLGFAGTLQYQTRAGAQIDDGKPEEACKIIDELYSKVRNGELQPEKPTQSQGDKSWSLTWDDVRSYAKKGHEFASHMVTHPYLAGLDEPNMLFEMEKSKEEILSQLGPEYTFSAEGPYGTENERVMEYAYKIYPALRNRMPESYLDELNRSSRKDPAASDKEYVQWQRGALAQTPMPLMKSWVDTTASENNIWLVLVIHGVDGIGWEALTSESLDEYFTYIKSRDNVLWIATFADAAKYMRERMNSTIKSDEKGTRLNITLSCSLEKSLYDLPLTLKTYVSATWKQVKFKQGKETRILSSRSDSHGNYVLYQAKPDAGVIEIEGM